jgi:hypothetical protein
MLLVLTVSYSNSYKGVIVLESIDGQLPQQRYCIRIGAIMNWEAITAISTVVATMVILITAVFAIMQLIEMKQSRRLDGFMRLFDELSSPEARENRAFIYNHLPTDPSQLRVEHFLKIDEVLSSFDRAMIYMEQGQMETHFVLDTYGEIFLRVWETLHPIVLYERGRRGGYYRQRTEALVDLARKYFLEKKPPLNYPICRVSDRNDQPDVVH